MPLPDEMWDIIIAVFAAGHGIRAAKELRRVARVSRVFASAARTHPDNCSPGDAALAMWKLRRKARPTIIDGEREGIGSVPLDGAMRLLSESDSIHCVA